MCYVRISKCIFFSCLIFTLHALAAHETDAKLGLSNLQKAEAFLSDISKKSTVSVLVPNRLYYEVLQQGDFLSMLKFFHYKIYTLENKIVIDTFKESKARQVCLDSTIIGFAKGVEGMKINEKRRLYIHPDLAYRNIGIFVPSESLIIVEVEAKEC